MKNTDLKKGDTTGCLSATSPYTSAPLLTLPTPRDCFVRFHTGNPVLAGEGIEIACVLPWGASIASREEERTRFPKALSRTLRPPSPLPQGLKLDLASPIPQLESQALLKLKVEVIIV